MIISIQLVLIHILFLIYCLYQHKNHMIETTYKPLQIPKPMRTEKKQKKDHRTPFILQRAQNAVFPEYQKSGSWKKQEVLKYTMFVQAFSSILENRQQCKEKQIFEHMARLIGTRNFNQCRSHHQMVVRQYGSAAQYLNEFKHETERLNSRFESFQNDLQSLKQKVIGQSQNVQTKIEYPSNFEIKEFGHTGFDKEQNKRTADSYQPIEQVRPRASSLKLKEKFAVFNCNYQYENDQASSVFMNFMNLPAPQFSVKCPVGFNYAETYLGVRAIEKEQANCEGVQQFRKWIRRFDQKP